MFALLGINVNVDVWFQQNGTTCHTSHATIYFLLKTFGGRLIYRQEAATTFGVVFLWGEVAPLKIRVMLTNQKQLPSVPLQKYDPIHSKKCMKIEWIEWRTVRLDSVLLHFTTKISYRFLNLQFEADFCAPKSYCAEV